jgi:erythromycin esterase-like protein
VEWLRFHNQGRAKEDKAGFYGLDLYSMGASIHSIISYLDYVDPELGKVARKRYGSLLPWIENPQQYSLGVLLGSFESSESKVLQMLQELLQKRLEYAALHEDGDEFHSAEQNARLVAGELSLYKEKLV